MTKEFEEWVNKNSIWMPDSDAMMFDVWNSILKFTSKSRTCESCKYGTLTTLGTWLECDITDIRELLSVVQETGIKCNKWSKKDD